MMPLEMPRPDRSHPRLDQLSPLRGRGFATARASRRPVRSCTRVVAWHESLPPSGTFGGRGTHPFGVRSPRGTPKTIGAGGDGLFQ